VREQIEALVRLGVGVGVISGTHVENIDSQLHARPTGPGWLHLANAEDFDSLHGGEKVIFDIEPSQKGPRAIRVRLS
jgi:hypothetical protein